MSSSFKCKCLAVWLCSFSIGLVFALQTGPSCRKPDQPRVRAIRFTNFKEVTIDEILARLKQPDIDLTTETRFDPKKVERAKAALKKLLAERGQRRVHIRTETHPVQPHSVEIVFTVEEEAKDFRRPVSGTN